MHRPTLSKVSLPLTLCLAVLVSLLPADTSSAEVDPTTRGMLAYLIAHSAIDEDLVPTRGTLAYLMAHSVGGLGSFEPPAEPTHSDVPEDNCAYAEVEYVVSLGLMFSYPDGLFWPDFEIDRGQMAVYTAWVINLTDGDLGSYIPPAPTFWDVPMDHWAYLYIEYIVEKGITTGYPDGSFRPADSMDAYEAADWLEAATGTYVDPGGVPSCVAPVVIPIGFGSFEPPAIPTYPDVPQDHCVYAEIEYVTWLEVMHGFADGLFHPDPNVTRDQAAVHTAGVIDLTDGDLGSFVPPAEPTFPDVPPEHWAYTEIEYLVSKGIPVSAPDGLFHPEMMMDVYAAAAWLEAATGTHVDPGSYPCIPEVLTVCIDIKPKSYPNAINLTGVGTIAVAMSMYDADAGCLDPSELDVSTLTLAGAPVATRNNGSYMAGWETVKSGKDKIECLVVHFNTEELGLCVGDEVGVLEGLTWDGVPARGEDSVWVFIGEDK
ncbi:MAG: S-layer homology domain-containing protein [Armatimonadota bacterium]|nr:MAG: S-layer homology domain-containing protein [Armatimonadota bacterium]